MVIAIIIVEIVIVVVKLVVMTPTNNSSTSSNVSERHGGNHSNSNTRHGSSNIDKNGTRNAATIELVVAVAIRLLPTSRSSGSGSSICHSSIIGVTAKAESSHSNSSCMLLAAIALTVLSL